MTDTPNYTRPEWLNKAPAQYQDILEKHDMWLKDIEGGERANLDDANLSGAYLRGAYLSGAYLDGAYLDGADLDGAYLDGADLDGANLRGANLRGANLRGANLRGAYLSGADLRGANLDGAYLDGADLHDTKRDFIDAISLLPAEVPNLRKALIEGRIDGSTYSGECACLAGTIANHMGKNVNAGVELGNGFVADPNSPRERLFLTIRRGDTPENNPISKLVVEWIDEAFPTAKEAA